MKATIIFAIILCVAVAVLSRRPQPSLQPYPVVFSARYNQSDLAFPWKAARMNNVFLDLPNRKASVNFAAVNSTTESWTLVFKPQGADPTTPAGQGYTMFAVNPSYPANLPNNCLFSTRSIMTLAPYPEHWRIWKNGSRVVEVNTWFDLPSDLVYGGEYFIAELGVMSDRWDTVSQCNLFSSGIGQVPCTSVMFSQGQNPLPLMDIRAYAARPDSFQNDKYAVRVYHSFTTSVQNSNFALPKNWAVNCGNADSDFLVSPENPYLSVSKNGGAATPLAIALTSPPATSLGNVKVYLSPNPKWNYNCVDCVSFNKAVLLFTADNWSVPQTLSMTYQHDGCSQYHVKATGGGYDWTYNTRTVTIYTCEGNKNCFEQPKCGTSALN